MFFTLRLPLTNRSKYRRNWKQRVKPTGRNFGLIMNCSHGFEQ